MIFGKLSYFATIIIFAGSAVLIIWALGFKKMKKYFRLVAIVMSIGITSTLFAEPAALSMRTWSYSPDKFSGVYMLGAPLETLIYSAFVSIAISSATIAWSSIEEDRKPLIKSTIKEIKKKLRQII